MKQYALLPAFVIASLTITITGCPICVYPFWIGYIYSPFRFSVNNKTDAELSVKLETGEIPSRNARYEEFTPFTDEVFQLGHGYQNLTADEETACSIKPKENNYVLTRLPLEFLPFQDDTEELKNRLMNRFISFTLTISAGDTTLYRVAGWDLPQADMEGHHINEKLYGYYDTAIERWFDERGERCVFPMLYSKLWRDRDAGFAEQFLRYYINVVSMDTVILQKFVTEDAVDIISDDDFWKEY